MRRLLNVLLLCAALMSACGGPVVTHDPTRLRSDDEQRTILGMWEGSCEGQGLWRSQTITSTIAIQRVEGGYSLSGHMNTRDFEGELEMSADSERPESVVFYGHLTPIPAPDLNIVEDSAYPEPGQMELTLYIERGVGEHPGSIRRQRSAYEFDVLCDVVWRHAAATTPAE